MGFILMYDITNEESFRAVSDWYDMLMIFLVSFILKFCQSIMNFQSSVHDLQQNGYCLLWMIHGS